MLLAGPGANFLFAIVAFWLLFQMGVPGLRPMVGEVRPDTPAATYSRCQSASWRSACR
jgi:regulator of sigma E protease